MITFPRWLRVAGMDAPAAQVLRESVHWLKARGIGVTLPPASADEDYAQVDPTLAVLEGLAPAPHAAVGYAGFSPQQRGAFLRWAEKPSSTLSEGVALPQAWKQLFCAGLEVTLVERAAGEEPATREILELLRTLIDTDAWRRDPLLTRLLILARRLTGEDGLLPIDAMPSHLVGVALGMEAMANPTAQLESTETIALVRAWEMASATVDPALVALRLDEYRTRIGRDPLLDALNGLSEGALAASPFRTAHRDLRLAFPHPDLRSTLEPLLEGVLAPMPWEEEEDEPMAEGITPVETTAPVAAQRERASAARTKGASRQAGKGKGWSLVLEFNESRSPYAQFALDLAQKQEGYMTLLDEDRSIVHRVTYRKSEMRRFWRLWEYVQGWSSTHVYLNGEELQKWQVWPWSQLFR